VTDVTPFVVVGMGAFFAGVANAPKFGDKAAWAPRIATGMDTLLNVALHGKGAMPPKGGNPALSEAQIRAAIEYMVSHSK
jgi:cytochrome c5